MAEWEQDDRRRGRLSLVAGGLALCVVAGLLLSDGGAGQLAVSDAVRDSEAAEVQPVAVPDQPGMIERAVRSPMLLGDLPVCAGGYRVALFDDPRRAMPPGFPGLADAGAPSGCAQDLADALAFGYPLAPPPEGAEQLAGVYFTRPHEGLAMRCEDAAAQLGHAVACPDLLPLGRLEGVCPIRFDVGNGCVMDEQVPGGGLRLRGSVVTARGIGLAPDLDCVTCRVQIVVTTESARDPARLTRCDPRDDDPLPSPTRPGGAIRCELLPGEPIESFTPHAGAALVRWVEGGVAIGVSALVGVLSEDSGVPGGSSAALAVAMANRLTVVPPPTAGGV
jgi:hypothetical protein